MLNRLFFELNVLKKDLKKFGYYDYSSFSNLIKMYGKMIGDRYTLEFIRNDIFFSLSGTNPQRIKVDVKSKISNRMTVMHIEVSGQDFLIYGEGIENVLTGEIDIKNTWKTENPREIDVITSGILNEFILADKIVTGKKSESNNIYISKAANEETMLIERFHRFLNKKNFIGYFELSDYIEKYGEYIKDDYDNDVNYYCVAFKINNELVSLSGSYPKNIVFQVADLNDRDGNYIITSINLYLNGSVIFKEGFASSNLDKITWRVELEKNDLKENDLIELEELIKDVIEKHINCKEIIEGKINILKIKPW